MDMDAPRELGDLEDAEAQPPRSGRTTQAKKTLEQFLEEFEANLREHPGEPATSAAAAVEGRAEGVWRTPIEGAERRGRRPGRAPARRADLAGVSTPEEAAHPVPAEVPYGPAGETLVDPDATTDAPPGEDEGDVVAVEPPGAEQRVDAAAHPTSSPPGPAPDSHRRRRRHRHGRRHR